MRTEQETSTVIRDIVSHALQDLEKDKEYRDALNKIRELQEPPLEGISERLKAELEPFLPDIRAVDIAIKESSQKRLLRSAVDLYIDDGARTSIDAKGEGFKSIVAMCLLRLGDDQPEASILLLEEPESHLHPDAVHKISKVVSSLSEESQIIITTHSPLFAVRDDLEKNVIVRDNTAIPARHISDIRDALGVRSSDNLLNARLVTLVEGSTDARVIASFFRLTSKELSDALDQGVLLIEPCRGAGRFGYYSGLYKSILCEVHGVFDDDPGGTTEVKRGLDSGRVTETEITQIRVPGVTESELEDCWDIDFVAQVLQDTGIPATRADLKGKARFSDRLKKILRDLCMPEDDKMIEKVKDSISRAAECDLESATHATKSKPLHALKTVLERRLSGYAE